MIKGIIFDLEGVIFDTESLWDIEVSTFLDRFGIKYDRDLVKPQMSGRTLQGGIEQLQNVIYPGQVVGDVETLAKERFECFRNLIASENADFIPGFEDFYQRISPDFMKIVATSMNKGLLDTHYLNSKLKNLFNGKICTVDSVPTMSKPNPHVFIVAASQMGLHPSECVVIEDSPNGIEAAYAAGSPSIGIATTYSADVIGKSNPSLVAQSFSELNTDVINSLYR